MSYILPSTTKEKRERREREIYLLTPYCPDRLMEQTRHTRTLIIPFPQKDSLYESLILSTIRFPQPNPHYLP